jgi:hypothetical protein
LNDDLLIRAVDETWRSPADIRRQVNLPGSATVIAKLLEDLADRAKIERKIVPTGILKRGKPVDIKMYRRCQP